MNLLSMVNEQPIMSLNKWSLLWWFKGHKGKERLAIFRPLLIHEHKQARMQYINKIHTFNQHGATISFRDEAWKYLWSRKKKMKYLPRAPFEEQGVDRDTATDRNVYYIDSISKGIKITTHCVSDEAEMILPPSHRSQANIALINTGYSNLEPGLDEPQGSLLADTDGVPCILDSQEVSPSIRAIHIASPNGSTMASTASPLQAPITDLHGHPTPPSVPNLPFDLYLSSDPFDYTI
jgi:hypothetical protein